MKVTPLIYEQIRAKHPELRLPMWPNLLPDDKKRAKRFTVEAFIVRRHMKLLARDPMISDRVKVVHPHKLYYWEKFIGNAGTEEIV